MMRADLVRRVRETVEKVLCVEIAPNSNPQVSLAELGADSMDKIELIMALEEKFDCEITDDEADKIKTLWDVVNFMEKKSWQE